MLAEAFAVLEPTLPTDQAIGRYLADCRRRRLRPATIVYYRTALDRFTQNDRCPTIGDLSRDEARRFQDECPSLSAGSMRGYLRALRTFSTWLNREDLLDTDPLAKLALPLVDTPLRLVPSDDQLLKLLDASAPSLRAVIALLAGTGLRISDACALEVPDLKVDCLHVQTTKNRGGRIVPLDDVLTAVLHVYLADIRPDAKPAEGTPLFVSRMQRRLEAGAVRTALTAAGRRAGIEITISPHVFRHWFARDLAAHGTSDRLLAARMGWTTRSLMDRYAPVSDAEIALDTARYSPLQRLADGGTLIRRLPSPMRGPRPSGRAKSGTDSGRSSGRT